MNDPNECNEVPVPAPDAALAPGAADPPPASRPGPHWGHLAVALGVFLADQVTKGIIDRWPDDAGRDVIPHLFRIIHVENPGVAFGLFQDASALWRGVLITASSLALLAVLAMLWRTQQTARSGYAMALIVGGACGNLFDRILHGRVVDFLLFYHGVHTWPAFNIADSSIVAGAALLVFEILHERAAPAPPGGALEAGVPAPAPGAEPHLSQSE